ncbi:MAG: hypothetical protein ACOX41_06660 [Anaerovoracaceae bacterium]
MRQKRFTAVMLVLQAVLLPAGASAGTAGAASTAAVQTGDLSHPGLLIIILLIAGITIAAAAVGRSKQD